ncbi:MAG: tetratricopeptide repeat protein [Armatimonadetes bacterium]|nr:tetratricopeptide repeat protein [Armatimonadota bacterium]
MRLIALTLLATVTLSGCSGPDGLRRQFVALRYLQSAQARLQKLPRDAERAVAELDRALELLPDDKGLRERAGPLYLAARAYDKAEPLLREHLSDDNPRTYVMLAQCLLHTGRVDEGLRICHEVLQRASREHQEGKIGPAELALILNDTGYVMAENGVELARSEKAIRAAVEAAPLQPAFVDSLGWVLYQQGEYRDAAFYLERAARLNPREDPEMLYHLGAAYARLGRLRDAEVKLRRAHQADPSWSVVEQELRRLGRTLVPPMVTVQRPPGYAPHDAGS